MDRLPYLILTSTGDTFGSSVSYMTSKELEALKTVSKFGNGNIEIYAIENGFGADSEVMLHGISIEIRKVNTSGVPVFKKGSIG